MASKKRPNIESGCSPVNPAAPSKSAEHACGGGLPMSNNTVSILDGSTFLVCSPNGDIDAGPDQPEGLFYQDMRHLSKWKLTMKGIPLEVLSTDAIEYYFAQHFCVPPTGTIYKNPNISIVRRRINGDAHVEDLNVLDLSAEAEEVELRLDMDADFA